MHLYEGIKDSLIEHPKSWLITGVAGFIGSNLLEELLKLNQYVVGIDNFSTGHKENLSDVKNQVDEKLWKNFHFYEADITELNSCKSCFENIDYVLHQAALGSVPRSIEDPKKTNDVNISGFLNSLILARDYNVKKFVFAGSSSTYGDHKDLPKLEENIGNPLSPYAVTKYVNELYADIFHKTFNLNIIGLRYFNVFGKRQDPNGAYAAVIPKWINSLIKNEAVTINGDGKTSRDFCYIDNVVQANILAAVNENNYLSSEIFNIAVGDRTTLDELFELIKENVEELLCKKFEDHKNYSDFRAGDVRHSQASINKAVQKLGYEPSIKVKEGISRTAKWFVDKNKSSFLKEESQ